MLGQKATIVIDLGFGDSGKGTVVDYLARNSRTSAVVRFNGGAQAAHNVYTTDGRRHTFAQFGSGMFVPGVKTHLSRYVLIDPPALLNEAVHLEARGVRDALRRLSIDERALVVTPFHKAANRIREVLRGSGKHGSVGMGVGETKADEIAFPHQAVYAGDLRSPETLVKKFTFFQNLKYDEFRDKLTELENDADLRDEVRLLIGSDAPDKLAVTFWKQAMRLRIVDGGYLGKLALEGDLIFEGAQGVLIDEWHGFHPYTTWSTATPDNARTLLREIGFPGKVETLGVVRAYFTRHGAGPFPTENKSLTLGLPDAHNTFGRWQENFRVGWFDSVLARYAIRVSGGVDALAVTNLDRVAHMPAVKIATGYRLASATRNEYTATVSEEEERGVIVRDLKKKPFLTDLHYQETLTGIVSRAEPLYADVSPGTLTTVIERELGVPVTLTSRGPTAAGKRTRAPLRLAA